MSALEELYSYIDRLPDNEVSRLLAIAQYRHSCSSYTVSCCGVRRCQVCHVDHLRSAHSEHAAMFWNKLCQSDRLTWGSSRAGNGVSTNGSTKPKAKTHSRKPRKEVNDPVRYQPVPRDLDIIRAAIARIAEIRAK